MKPLTSSILAVMLAEAGSALTMLNAAPHPPLGFWLWFGGIAAFSRAAGVWMYRQMMAAKA